MSKARAGSPTIPDYRVESKQKINCRQISGRAALPTQLYDGGNESAGEIRFIQ